MSLFGRAMRPALVLGLVLAGTGQARAQEPRQFLVSVRGEYQAFAESSALRGAPAAGLETTYFLNRNLGVGLQLSASRPWTKGEYFPLVRNTFWTPNSANDTTLLYVVNQQVTAFDYSLQAEYRMPMDRFEPFVQGGVGGYTIFPNSRAQPQSDRSRDQMSGALFSLGGGVSVALGENSRVMLAASDRIYTGYDREELSVSDRLLREDRFVNPLPSIPEAQSTIHNLRFSLGFSFIPGRDQ